jgi:hypothetical protein
MFMRKSSVFLEGLNLWFPVINLPVTPLPVLIQNQPWWPLLLKLL